MRRLTGTSQDERGVTLVLVSVFAVAMMAMAALVADVGAMVHERRELQNGADAVALSVAHSCALAEPGCAATPSDSVLASLAGANTVDGATAVEAVDVDTSARTVTVRTRTETDSGAGILPFNFARGGETLHATSVAAWGAPRNARVIPLGISVCEWEQVELDVESTTIFHSPSGDVRCSRPSGADAPGGFGWLDTPDADCSLELGADGLASADTGVSLPRDCDLDELLGEELLVPIYDVLSGSGTNTKYHIVGFASFRLDGFNFPANHTNPRPCPAQRTCVRGTFTRFVPSSGGPTGGGEFGVSIVKLVS